MKYMRENINTVEMINQLENSILEILKESLHDIPANIFPSPDYTTVFQELRVQSLLPIAYIWMKKQKIIDENLKKGWIQVYTTQTYRWYAMMKEQSDIIDLLSSKGYSVAVMKGNSIAWYYPKPQLRVSSDIDLLVRWEEYDEIYDFLLNNGYYLIGEKEEKKHHFAVLRNQYVIEVHKRPGGTRLNGTEGQTELLHFFQDGLNYIEWKTCCGYRIPVLPPIHNAMILLLHTAQHMKGGLGLRHIIDWMMFAKTNVNNDFWYTQLEEWAVKGHVDLLAKIMTRMCQKYLGLTTEITWAMDVDEIACDQLMEYVFQQGDFGIKAGREDTEVRLLAESQSIGGFWRRLNKSSLYSMPVAQKYKLLMPVALLYQLFRYVIKWLKCEHPIRTFFNDKKAGKERAELFQKLGLRSE